MSVEFDIQAALYQAAEGLGLTAYDTAPQVDDSGTGADWPYVEVGEIDIAEWDDKGKRGFDFVVRLHTRSRSHGMKEAKDIQGQLYGALHLGGLTIPGHRVTLLRRESSRCFKAPNGSIHGVCDYRGLIEATA